MCGRVDVLFFSRNGGFIEEERKEKKGGEKNWKFGERAWHRGALLRGSFLEAVDGRDCIGG